MSWRYECIVVTVSNCTNDFVQISDLSFRRHILVQVLIVMDFLLSLSAKAKEKLSKASLPDNANKSVMYADWTLSEDDVRSPLTFHYLHYRILGIIH